MSRTFLFTSEAVSEGHPDKLCDQVSDAIVDAFLAIDPDSKTAIETAVKNNDVFLLGEINTKAKLTNQEYEVIVRDTIKRIGFEDAEHSIDYKSCNVHVFLDQQSPDIAQAVHENKNAEEIGAGDQGLMSAYASNETHSMMPTSFQLANKLAWSLSQARKTGKMTFLRPDGKTQITLKYYEDAFGQLYPICIDTIILSTQHDETVTNEQLRDQIFKGIVIPTIAEFEENDLITLHQSADYRNFDYERYYAGLPKSLTSVIYKLNAEMYNTLVKPVSRLIKPDTKILINPSGRFVIGGPKSDSGLTGRKIVCDAFGGWSQVGGGAYSGKDYSKVDRSASYLCRQICKSLVAGGYANRVSVQLGYAIGISDPVSIYVDTYGFYDSGLPHGKMGIRREGDLVALIQESFRLKPGHIVQDLGLKRPIFGKISSYGHFGRTDLGEEICMWEQIKKI
ncbi:S-adenosylmethionine_synthetase [Hexamita inflata]|uniref:methionine adenosyltransferase n=1 Tax=Hexamita inflata TaxID=28002 RepID=A0AA86PSL1_9EUKA|nr:S-adenosylmethionine synthetase [Hexamita inflata]